jgi:phosphohistidine swiveling domain-containing protein
VKLAADSPSAAVEREFRRTIEFNKKRWSITSALRMPQLVRGPADIRTFELEPTSPNFITSQRVVAAPVLVDALERPADLTGRVALIRSADPGYDWVFGHGIVGLVTEFGGIGSHMAVRSAEHGLPAAIGCGPAIFDRLASATAIELDCAHRVVRPVA